MKISTCFLIFMFLEGGAGLPAQNPPSPMVALETSYAEDRADALRRVLARYVDELEALEYSLATSGDGSGAARVRLERDRILPALGLPVDAPADADDFAAFEEVGDLPVPAAPVTLPGDLDATLKSLMPPGPDKSSATAAPAGAETGPKGANRTAKRVLRMTNAQLSGTYDPLYGYTYWTAGNHASWTLSDLTPGSYRLVLRYACDEKNNGGGKLLAQFGGVKIESEVPPTGGWKRRRELIIGPFQIKDSRADLMLMPAPAGSGAVYLMDLTAILVQPLPPAVGSIKP